MNLPVNVSIKTPTLPSASLPTVSGTVSLPKVSIKTPTLPNVGATTDVVAGAKKGIAKGLSGIMAGIKKPNFANVTVGSIGSIVKLKLPFSLPKLPKIAMPSLPAIPVPELPALPTLPTVPTPVASVTVTSSGMAVSGSI